MPSQSSSIRRSAGSTVTAVSDVPVSHERSHTDPSHEGTGADGLVCSDDGRDQQLKGKDVSTNSLAVQTQVVTGSNGVIDKRFLWGVFSGIGLAFVLPALVRSLNYLCFYEVIDSSILH